MNVNTDNIIEETLVPHDEFVDAENRLDQCYRFAKSCKEPICIALVGESRTGKSRLMEEFNVRYPIVRYKEGLYVPVLRVRTPSKPTVKGLAELMLWSLSDPNWNKGTEIEKTARLLILMREAGTQMVMIDEFQHFSDMTSKKVQYHVSDWLKNLVEDAEVALAVAGLHRCLAVLSQNPQLEGRFMTPVFLHRFDWKNAKHREEFIAILDAFDESITRYFDMPKLSSDKMAFRCYCGTGGLIGYLTKFLRQAVMNATDSNSKTITIDDLLLAHRAAVWIKSGPASVSNPFSKEFNCEPSEELLTEITSIGQASDEPVRPKGNRKSKRNVHTAQSVLSGR